MAFSMSSQLHQKHLSSYLRKKKNSPAKDLKSLQSSSKVTSAHSSCPNCKPEKQVSSSIKTHSVQKHIGRIKAKSSDHVNRLPDELIFKIFRYLSLSEVLVCAQVCTRWSTLSKDRSIWQDIFLLLPQEIRKQFSFNETKEDHFDWKKQVILRCMNARNSKFASSKKKVNPYTGLQADVQIILKNIGVRWKICFTDTRGKGHWSMATESTYFNSSLSVRWLSLQLPSLTQLKTMKIFACVPVFFDRAWKPHEKSAATHSLLMSFELKEKGYVLSKEKCDAEDDMITAHFIFPELLIACWSASWKDSGEISFVTACLHYNNLVKRVLHGSYTCIVQGPLHKPILDDIDSQYGLHGYSAMVELRNHKVSYWSHQIRDLNCSDMTADIIFLRDFPNGSCNKKITLPWKTELFRNTLQDVCILDFTLLDEHRKPIWCKSSPVKAHQNNSEVNYDNEGDFFYMTYTDERGTLRIDFTWNSKENQTCVAVIEFSLWKSFVNQWFGRSY